MANTLDTLSNSYNFRIRSLYARVKKLVGGSDIQVETWWRTPLPHAPFNLRAPEELLVDDKEWLSVRDWLTENISGSWDDNDTTDQYYETIEQLNNPNERAVDMDVVKAEGGSKSYFEDYIIHTYTSSGDFTVYHKGMIEYLIVGGGGGGGGWSGSGGGGGGGVVTGRTKILPGVYQIKVGAGGSAGSDIGDARASSSGRPSSAFDVTAFGGGVGGCPVNVKINGMPEGYLDGYATGGGGYNNNGTWLPGKNNQLGAAGRNGQGFAGGNGNATCICGGGGGGAGGPGGNAILNPDGSSGRAGAGGIGVMSDITGLQIYYGGGGGGGAHGVASIGGAGGLGGGASAPLAGQPTINTGPSPAGATNRGGGGAGASGLTGIYGVNGGAGGSGIVIIRYKNAQGLKGTTYGNTAISPDLANVTRYLPGS